VPKNPGRIAADVASTLHRGTVVSQMSTSSGILRLLLIMQLCFSLVAIPTLPAAASGPNGVLVSENGVPLSVRLVSPTGYWVTTPCGRLASVGTGTLVGNVVVALDPGHGGPRDPGAVGATGLSESSLNLEIAKRTAHELDRRGVSTLLTRSGNYPVRLDVRAELADNAGAELLVSIHHNAPTPGPSAEPGVEIFIQHDSTASRRLGGILWEDAMEALSRFDVDWTAAFDAGVMTVMSTRGDDAYGIIRYPETPTALIELGYISHRPEAELFGTDDYREAAAMALADGIERYLTTDDGGAGYVEGRTFNPLPGISRSRCVDPYVRGLETLSDRLTDRTSDRATEPSEPIQE
jgi:N-acetylmuramoyl-L-alanine amidase